MVYTLLLALHNVTRWAVIGTAVWALVVVYKHLFTDRRWTPAARKAGGAFMGTVGLQLILGLVLWFFGPYSPMGGDMAAMMQDAALRFFAAEHPVSMILAFVIATAGYSVSKRVTPDRKKLIWAAVLYTVAVLLVLAFIPWPGMEAGRSLLPRF